MNVVFLSNYFSHHQKFLSDALANRCGYTFVNTVEMARDRQAMGWAVESEPEYLCSYSQDPERVKSAIEKADVIIAGVAPRHLIRECVRRGKLIFRYSERPLKEGPEPLKYLPRLIRWHTWNPPGRPIYLLCASAYAAGDYARFGLFRGKAFRWGYFPEFKEYENLPRLLENKKKASILWAGRLLEWKHPEAAVAVAAVLKAEGFRFDLDIIGIGPAEQSLREMVKEKGLEDCVHLLGVMTPEMVRRRMEESEIYLFTSDRREGWGAVLNEAMNSGCAVVTSDAAGAAPYLIEDGKNGLLYPSGDQAALLAGVKRLLTAPELPKELGRKAYHTVGELWNAEVAAERFVTLAQRILAGEKKPDLYKSGPCSREKKR